MHAVVSICYLVFDGKYMFHFHTHVVFPHSTAQWTIPTVTGDIPPPIADFSFTKISSDQAVLFGGDDPGFLSGTSDIRLATVSRDSVVSV